MNKIFKICLISALFFATASAAVASLNYDSANNYFLIDSLLKSGGNYILVGNAFGEIANSFAVSNNLIFWQDEGLFTTDDGIRQMGTRQLGGNIESFLKSNKILVKSTNNDFQLSPVTGSLLLESPTIAINKNLILTGGLSLKANQDLNTIFDNTIYSNKILTQSLKLLDLNSDTLTVKSGTKLTVSSGGTATAESITLGGDDFCKVVTWDTSDDISNLTAHKTVETINTQSSGSDLCIDTSTNTDTTSRACCPTNYFVFNLDVDTGKMICCRVQTR